MARPGSVVSLFAGAMAVLLLGVVAMATIAWLIGGAGGGDQTGGGAGATTSVGASSDAGWRTDLDAALAVLHDQTDLELRVIGEVDESPARDRSPHQPRRYGDRWAPVLVAWASPGDDLPLRGTDRGLGIPVAVGSDGDRIYVSGQVVLNADRDDLQVGDSDRSDSWGATVLHELIHVLGLGHVEDPRELMAVSPGHGPVELGTGDRAGLAAVGTNDGCLDVPAARPVVVESPAIPGHGIHP